MRRHLTGKTTTFPSNLLLGQIQIRNLRGFVHRADEAFHVGSECVRIAPRASRDDHGVRIEHQLAVWSSAHRLVVDVVHGVGEPPDAGAQTALRLDHVHQSLLDAERADVVVELRVGQRLVNVEELNTLRRVV